MENSDNETVDQLRVWARITPMGRAYAQWLDSPSYSPSTLEAFRAGWKGALELALNIAAEQRSKWLASLQSESTN